MYQQDGIKIYQQRIQELKRGIDSNTLNTSFFSKSNNHANNIDLSQKIESTEQRIYEHKRRQQRLLENRLNAIDEAYQTALRLETARHQNTMKALINPLQKQLQDLQIQQSQQSTQRHGMKNKKNQRDDENNEEDDDEDEDDNDEDRYYRSGRRSTPRAKIIMKIDNNRNNNSFNGNTVNQQGRRGGGGMVVSQKLSSSFTDPPLMRDHANNKQQQYQQGAAKIYTAEEKASNSIRGKVQLISVRQGKENMKQHLSIAETSKEGSKEYLKYRKIPLGQSYANNNRTMNVTSRNMNSSNCSTNTTSRSIESHSNTNHNKGKEITAASTTARNGQIQQKQQNSMQNCLKPSTLRRQSLIARVLAQEDNNLLRSLYDDDDSF